MTTPMDKGFLDDRDIPTGGKKMSDILEEAKKKQTARKKVEVYHAPGGRKSIAYLTEEQEDWLIAEVEKLRRANAVYLDAYSKEQIDSLQSQLEATASEVTQWVDTANKVANERDEFKNQLEAVEKKRDEWKAKHADLLQRMFRAPSTVDNAKLQSQLEAVEKEREGWLNEKHKILGHVRDWEITKKELEAENAELKADIESQKELIKIHHKNEIAAEKKVEDTQKKLDSVVSLVRESRPR